MKDPLIFWDKAIMGKLITAQGYCKHTLWHLEEFLYKQLCTTEDYIYILQDDAFTYMANSTTQALKVKGLHNDLFYR